MPQKSQDLVTGLPRKAVKKAAAAVPVVVGDPGKGISEGKRNSSLFRLGCVMRGKGLNKQQVLWILEGENKYCSPPLTGPELDSVVNSVCKNKQGKDPITWTVIPGLVNLINDDEILKYLLIDDTGKVYFTDYVDIDGKIYRPKQRGAFKMASPEIMKTEPVDPAELLKQTESFIEDHVEMPHSEDYLPLALWVGHTYFIESFDYTPYLYFYGPRRTGKSQAGMSIISLAYFGEALTSPTEAVMFRSAEYFHSALLIDEIKIFGEGCNPALEVMLKVRYKRGLFAERADHKLPREDDLLLFDVFGPVVISSTEMLDETIKDRSFLFFMQQNKSRKVEGDIDLVRAQDLRDLWTVYRAQHLGEKIPDKPWIARRRLGEISSPLYRTLMFMDPSREDEFKDFVGLSELESITNDMDSFEAEVVEAILKHYADTGENEIETNKIVKTLNSTRSYVDTTTAHKVKPRLIRMNFKPCKMKISRRNGVCYTEDFLKDKAEYYHLDFKDRETFETFERFPEVRG